jgi:RNA-directed DNA polymerase
VPTSFDEISHPALLARVRKRIADKRVLVPVKAFLKSGVCLKTGSPGIPRRAPRKGLYAQLRIKTL